MLAKTRATDGALYVEERHSHEITSNGEAQTSVSQTNHELKSAAIGRFWKHTVGGQLVALRLFSQFAETVSKLERWGWSVDRIRAELAPCREIFATSPFMRRCQQWQRGHAGDFETIDYLTAGVNQCAPGSVGWHFEEILLNSPIARQHRNRLQHQSQEIAHAVRRNRTARILSIACGGCLDWLPVLPLLDKFAGKIVLNDCDPGALALATERLQPVAGQIQLAAGDILRLAKRLGNGGRFDLVVAGGLFDYLSDTAAIFLLNAIRQYLLASGGVLFFTNIAKGNPWRTLMEHGSNWNLIERTEKQIRELCRDAGISQSAVSLERDSTELTILTRVEQRGMRVVS